MTPICPSLWAALLSACAASAMQTAATAIDSAAAAMRFVFMMILHKGRSMRPDNLSIVRK
jgi:hypothetical protein